jgi:hypothetical protein
MPATAIQEIYKDKVEFRLRQRYADEIETLKELGFTHLTYVREINFPLSALVLGWVLPLMSFRRELYTVEGLLRLVTFNPVMFAPVECTYAEIFNLGVQFFTQFTDGTLLISANYPNTTITDYARRFYKYHPPLDEETLSIQEAFERHQQRSTDFQVSGYARSPEFSLVHFEGMLNRSTAMNLRPENLFRL